MPRTRLNLGPAVLAILLGAAVVVAANGRTWSSHAAQSGWSTRTFALMMLAGGGVVWLLIALTIWRHRSSGLTWPLAIATLGPIVLLTLALTVVALLWQRITPHFCAPDCHNPIRVIGSSIGGSAPVGAGGNRSGPASPGKLIGLKSVHSHPHPTSWLWIWLGLAVLVIGATAWLWSQRRARPRPTPAARAVTSAEHDEQAEIVEAEAVTRYVELSLDDLHRERDLRRAIIASYARMEQLLTHIGTPRELWETPTEYLQRTDPRQAAPLDRLTTLYEEAQFSPHALDEPRRTEAIDALTALRRQYRSSPA